MRQTLKLFGVAAACAALVLAMALLLPHDRYIRFQSVQTEAWRRLGWAYERIHFDPTPIDVAFIGTSRTMNGIDPQAVERAAAGAGRCLHATNFAIPAYGRNLHWIMARELLENRRVGTLVIEVFENETRQSHPYFHRVAELGDVLGAPPLINLRWAEDIALMPARQALLALKTLWPAQFGLHRNFDPARYDGPNPDATRQVVVGGVAYTGVRDRIADPAGLERQARTTLANKDLNMLGPWLRDLEFNVPRRYLDAVLDLAARKGVPVRFLYLPSYGMPEQPFDMSFYQDRGPMITVNDVLAERNNWGDFNHMNLMGAALASRRVGAALADVRGAPTEPDRPAGVVAARQDCPTPAATSGARPDTASNTGSEVGSDARAGAPPRGSGSP